MCDEESGGLPSVGGGGGAIGAGASGDVCGGGSGLCGGLPSESGGLPSFDGRGEGIAIGGQARDHNGGIGCAVCGNDHGGFPGVLDFNFGHGVIIFLGLGWGLG